MLQEEPAEPTVAHQPGPGPEPGPGPAVQQETVLLRDEEEPMEQEEAEPLTPETTDPIHQVSRLPVLTGRHDPETRPDSGPKNQTDGLQSHTTSPSGSGSDPKQEPGQLKSGGTFLQEEEPKAAEEPEPEPGQEPLEEPMEEAEAEPSDQPEPLMAPESEATPPAAGSGSEDAE